MTSLPLALTFASLIVAVTNSRQEFITEPEHQSVNLGASVTFPCTIRNLVGVVQWTRDGFGLGLGTALEGFRRYSITGDTHRGDWSLSITPVELEDAAEYQCQVGGTLTQAPIRSRRVRLAVKVAPQPPRILQVDGSERMQVLAGRQLKLTCISKGGSPQATIQWWWDGGPEIKEGVLTSSEQEEEKGGKFTTFSTLKFKVDRKHSGLTLKCSAHNGAETVEQLEAAKARVTLDVRFPPVVKIRQLGGSSTRGLVREGDGVVLVCEATGNPKAFTYSWALDGGDMAGWRVEEERVTLTRAARHLGGRTVTCRVSNTAGTNSDQITLDVSYGPSSVSVSGTKTGREGAVISLSCLADSHPPAIITWYQLTPNKQKAASEVNLTFPISRQSEGKYLCEAHTAGFPKIQSKPVQVVLLRKPQISSEDKVFLSSPSETAAIKCRADMSLHGASLAWSYRGEELNGEGSEKYEILDSQVGALKESKLVIQQTEEEDFGTYQCTATNTLGRDVALVELRQKGELSTGSLLLSCLLGAGLTISILAAVYCTRTQTSHGRFSPPSLPLNFFQRSDEQKTAPRKPAITNGDGARSGDRVSPCSSEVFFEHFNKRNGGGAVAGEELYQASHRNPPGGGMRTAPSATEKVFLPGPCPPVGSTVCNHSSAPVNSTSLETKSCQTVPSEYESRRSRVEQRRPAVPPPDVTNTCTDGPQEQSDGSGQNSQHKSCEWGPTQSDGSYGNASDTTSKANRSEKLNGDSINHRSGHENGMYKQPVHENGSTRGQHQNHTNARQELSSALSSSCLHQPAVNYYANSIYLSRDLPPLYLPNGNGELQYGGQYPESRQTHSLDYHGAMGDNSWHNSFPPASDYATLRSQRSDCEDAALLGEPIHLVPDYPGLPSQSDYATWNYRRQRLSAQNRERRSTGVRSRDQKRYITGIHEKEGGPGASDV